MSGISLIVEGVPLNRKRIRRPELYAPGIGILPLYSKLLKEGGNGKSRKDVLGRHSKNVVRVKFLSVASILTSLL